MNIIIYILGMLVGAILMGKHKDKTIRWQGRWIDQLATELSKTKGKPKDMIEIDGKKYSKDTLREALSTLVKRRLKR